MCQSFGRNRKGQAKTVTSTLAIIELANALRKYGLGKEVKDVVDAVFSLGIQIFEVDPLDVTAVRIFDNYGISLYNCVHVAIMKRIGVTKIISADKDFDKIA
ncbi:MAG: type II toxin-antitoxin system VapC family toxin [Candidatus Bathyarchaeia archaeon]